MIKLHINWFTRFTVGDRTIVEYTNNQPMQYASFYSGTGMFLCDNVCFDMWTPSCDNDFLYYIHLDGTLNV